MFYVQKESTPCPMSDDDKKKHGLDIKPRPIFSKVSMPEWEKTTEDEGNAAQVKWKIDCSKGLANGFI